MNGAGVAIAFLFLVPMYVWAVSTFLPLVANADLTRFSGKYHPWEIVHLTGTVLGSNTMAQTHTRITQTETGRRYDTSTNLLSNIRLLHGNGNQTEVNLTNFGHSCREGDVITVWYAKKGRRSIPFVVCNVTTEQQYNPGRHGGIGAVIITHVNLFVVFFIVTLLASFFAGGLGIFLFFAMIVVVGVGWNRTRRHFLKKGLRPFWAKSREEAQALLPATS